MKWINVSSVAYLPHQTFLYSGKEGIACRRLRANIKIKRFTLSSSTAQYSGQIKFLIANKIGPFRNIQKNAITAKIHQASLKRARWANIKESVETPFPKVYKANSIAKTKQRQKKEFKTERKRFTMYTPTMHSARKREMHPLSLDRICQELEARVRKQVQQHQMMVRFKKKSIRTNSHWIFHPSQTKEKRSCNWNNWQRRVRSLSRRWERCAFKSLQRQLEDRDRNYKIICKDGWCCRNYDAGYSSIGQCAACTTI